MKKEILALIVPIALSFGAYGQSFSLSLNSGIGSLMNGEQVRSEFFVDWTGTGNTDLMRDRKPWFTNQISVERWFLDNRFSVSIGVSAYHFKLSQDSVLPVYNSAIVHGERRIWRSEFLPTIGCGYRFDLSPNLSLFGRLDYGILRIIERRRNYTKAYDGDLQDYYYVDNSGYDGSIFDWDVSTNSSSLELSALLQLKRGSVNYELGPSYFLLFQPDHVDHHSLFLKLGFSFSFKTPNED